MSKKLKIPKSVLELQLSPKKFAKKYNIKLKAKKKKDKKRLLKKLQKEYTAHAINGLNKAVKILAENPDTSKKNDKKINKVKNGVENIILNPVVMKKIAKNYKKDPESYSNIKYLPYMIMNTIAYYKRDGISDEEKEVFESIDCDSLITFCEKILKKQIKKYEKKGLTPEVAYQMATVIPTAKLFKERQWIKRMITSMYDIAEVQEVDIDSIVKSVLKIDKKKQISKKEFLEKFFSEFIMMKSSNKTAKYSDTQKELHEGLIERTLVYLDNLKSRKCREILKNYIKRRKSAEKYKNDSKRVIKFTDHANSNSPYTNIKKVVTSLIEDNASNELYLS